MERTVGAQGMQPTVDKIPTAAFLPWSQRFGMLTAASPHGAVWKVGINMTFSEKLAKLRRRQGMSQEQLADRLDVTRQSVSKWESGAAMPELGKLTALSELFQVSLDYLLKDYVEEQETTNPALSGDAAARLEKKVDALANRNRVYSYTSRRKIFGLPLLSVRFGHGRNSCRETLAVGIVAVGNFSVGVISIGVISAGLLPIGMIALGGMALGMVSIGAVAFGAVAIGYLAVGASALGVYAVGAAAQGLCVAVGAAAKAAAAVGLNAKGNRMLLADSATTAVQVMDFLRPELENLWGPLRGIITFVLNWVL